MWGAEGTLTAPGPAMHPGKECQWGGSELAALSPLCG